MGYKLILYKVLFSFIILVSLVLKTHAQNEFIKGSIDLINQFEIRFALRDPSSNYISSSSIQKFQDLFDSSVHYIPDIVNYGDSIELTKLYEIVHQKVPEGLIPNFSDPYLQAFDTTKNSMLINLPVISDYFDVSGNLHNDQYSLSLKLVKSIKGTNIAAINKVETNPNGIPFKLDSASLALAINDLNSTPNPPPPEPPIILTREEAIHFIEIFVSKYNKFGHFAESAGSEFQESYLRDFGDLFNSDCFIPNDLRGNDVFISTDAYGNIAYSLKDSFNNFYPFVLVYKIPKPIDIVRSEIPNEYFVEFELLKLIGINAIGQKPIPDLYSMIVHLRVIPQENVVKAEKITKKFHKKAVMVKIENLSKTKNPGVYQLTGNIIINNPQDPWIRLPVFNPEYNFEFLPSAIQIAGRFSYLFDDIQGANVSKISENNFSFSFGIQNQIFEKKNVFFQAGLRYYKNGYHYTADSIIYSTTHDDFNNILIDNQGDPLRKTVRFSIDEQGDYPMFSFYLGLLYTNKIRNNLYVELGPRFEKVFAGNLNYNQVIRGTYSGETNILGEYYSIPSLTQFGLGDFEYSSNKEDFNSVHFDNVVIISFALNLLYKINENIKLGAFFEPYIIFGPQINNTQILYPYLDDNSIYYESVINQSTGVKNTLMNRVGLKIVYNY